MTFRPSPLSVSILKEVKVVFFSREKWAVIIQLVCFVDRNMRCDLCGIWQMRGLELRLGRLSISNSCNYNLNRDEGLKRNGGKYLLHQSITQASWMSFKRSSPNQLHHTPDIYLYLQAEITRSNGRSQKMATLLDWSQEAAEWQICRPTAIFHFRFFRRSVMLLNCVPFVIILFFWASIVGFIFPQNKQTELVKLSLDGHKLTAWKWTSHSNLHGGQAGLVPPFVRRVSTSWFRKGSRLFPIQS